MTTCETCKWWIAGETRTLSDSQKYEAPGQCRRQPPTAPRQWPRTERGDWCGEHSQFSGPITTMQETKGPEPKDLLLELDVDRARPATAGATAAQPAGAPVAPEGDPKGGTPSTRKGRSGPRR